MILRVIMLLAAYLVGSIPFGYLIVRMTQGADVRETGSGGTGATNVTRRAGKGAGILTLVLDALKGALVVIVARALHTEGFGVDWWVAASAVLAVAGHCFPVWLGFRGGKGVATGLGVFLALAPLAVVCALPIFVVVVMLTRYVSLGSILTAAVLPFFVWLMGGRVYPEAWRAPQFATAVAGGALIIFMHRANIGRLLKGSESKLKL